jgi:SurA-like protein/parvulin-like peptidyl-prolyl cis-trans isomerase-like protein
MIAYLQTHMRRHGKILLILVMGLVIVSLLYFGNARPVHEGGQGNYQVYGRNISKADFESAKDAFAFFLSLQYGKPIHRNDVDNPESHRQILMNLALAEKAHRLGIRVTDEEVGLRIRAMPIFQVNGQFSEQRFTEILANELPKRRLNEGNLQEIVSMQIALARLNELISTTALVSPADVDEYLRLLNEKMEVAVAKFDEKSFKSIAPPDENQLKAFYKENEDRFRVPKKIKVIYVEFPVPADATKPTDAELRAMYDQNVAQMGGQTGGTPKFEDVKELLRKAVNQQHQQETINKVGRIATDFSLKFATEGKEKPDFRALAAEEKLPVKETDYVSGPADLKGIKAAEHFAAEIAKLSKDNPVSLPVPAENVIYVAHWLDTRESTVPEFAQVKDKVLELWKRNAALTQARETGKSARAKFGQLLAEGKTFDQASKTLGLRWENLPPFSMRDIAPTDSNRFFKQSALSVRAGTAGDFHPDPTGGFFIFVKNKQPIDPAKLAEQRPEVEALLDRNTRGITLFEFRRKVLEESGLMPLFAEAEGADEPQL